MMSEQKKASFRDYIASNAIPIMVEAVYCLVMFNCPIKLSYLHQCFILLFALGLFSHLQRP